MTEQSTLLNTPLLCSKPGMYCLKNITIFIVKSLDLEMWLGRKVNLFSAPKQTQKYIHKHSKKKGSIKRNFNLAT